MQKSVIQELEAPKPLPPFRNSFTTSFNDGGHDLRKYPWDVNQIQNSSSSQLQEIRSLYETIEIERISEEIQVLRIALKDSQKQAFNCQSYQIQIRQLTDQCHEYDIQLASYKSQLQKLNMVCQKLYQQLQQHKQKLNTIDPQITEKYQIKLEQCQNLVDQLTKWKDRHKALEKSKDKQLEDLKQAMECQRKSMIDREIKQLNIKFDEERNYLEGNIKKMQEENNQKQNELAKLNYEVEALRIANQANQQSTKKAKELENKLNRLTEEMVRLNQLLRKKQEQIEIKNTDEDNYKQQIKFLEREKQNSYNEILKIPKLQQLIKQYTVKYSRLENENNSNRQQLKKIPNLENNVASSEQEIERLSGIIKNKLNEINDGNIKYEKLITLYQQSKKSQQKIPNLQKKINQLISQLERLSQVLKRRLIQIQQGKNKISLLEKGLKTFEQAEPEKKKIEEEYKKQLREIEKNKIVMSEMQKQLNQIPQLQGLLEDQRKIRQEYINEIDHLNKGIKDKSEEIETLNEKIYHIENKVAQLSNLEQEINSYKQQNNRMLHQIDSMNNKIKEKCQELDQLTEAVLHLEKNLENYQEVQRNLIANIEKTEKIIQELNNTKNQLKNTEGQLLERESELNEAKNTIMEINNDRQLLNRNLNIKTQELEHAKTEITTYLEQIRKLRQIQQLYNSLKQQLRITTNKLKDTQQHLKKQRNKTQQLNHRNQMLTTQLDKIHRNGYFPQQFRTAYSSMKSKARKNEKQLENIARKQQMMEKIINDVERMIVNVSNAMKVKNCQWVEINGKIVDMVSNIKTMSNLLNQNNELRLHNLQLESQIKMLNLQLADFQSKKNAGQALPLNNLTSTPIASLSLSNHSSHGTVSKKTIDPIIEDQSNSRVSNLSINNNKRVFSDYLNNVDPLIGNSVHTLKQQQQNSNSKKISTNTSITPISKSHINYNIVNSNYHTPINSGTSSIINSIRGASKQCNSTNGIGSVTNFSSPSSKNFQSYKQSIQNNINMKGNLKASSIKQPFTFKTCYRS